MNTKLNKTIIFLFSFLLLFIWTVHSNITNAIVYSDRALVTRVNGDNGISGLNQIEFKNIPLSVDQESFRADGFSVKGGKLKILDIKLEKNYEKDLSDNEINELKSKIEKVKNDLDKLKSKLNRIKNQRKILDIFSKSLRESNNEDLEKGRFSSSQWKEAIDYYKEEVEKLDNDKFNTGAKVKKKKEELRKLEDQFSKYKNKYTFYTFDVIVKYQLAKNSEVEILLSYIVPNSYWYPIYDCRLDIEKNELNIGYYAKVYQNTGENWDNVKLILSTARPDISGQIPSIYPWELDFDYSYGGVSKGYDKDSRKMKSAKKREYSEMEEALAPEAEFDKEVDESYSADIDSKGLALNYETIGDTIIPSGEEIKVTISKKIELSPKLSWAIVPRLSESSYLKGKIKNESDFTFLPGEINIFVNDSYIGKSSIELINPNQEFELSLGRDPRVKAEFKLGDVDKGVKINKRYEKRKYLITIQNNTDQDIDINIKDTVPKSLQPKSIIVKIIQVDPEPKEIKNESICIWELKIKQNEKIKIIEEWYVEYPGGSDINL